MGDKGDKSALEVWVLEPLVGNAEFLFENPQEMLRAMRELSKANKGPKEFSCTLVLRHMSREALDAVEEL